MKIYFLTIIITAFGMINSCDESGQDQEFEAISYEASSRGFHLKIDLTGNKLTVGNRMSTEERIISDGDPQLESIMTHFNQLDLKTIPDLKAPSQESSRDAAAIAYFSVKTGETTYETDSFDHGNPPAEVAPIIDALLKLAKVE